MTTVRLFMAVATASLITSASSAQEMELPKPGPEHAQLKKMEGNWDVTMNAGGQKSKGSAVYKMELGGLWLRCDFECEMNGQKFVGKGFDTYDAIKKKYVSVWLDSFNTLPMVSEGTYDAAKKALTLHGEMRHGTEMMKVKMVSEMPDDNTIKFAMYPAEGKEPMFSIEYKRKK